jgi:hypothetical protein
VIYFFDDDPENPLVETWQIIGWRLRYDVFNPEPILLDDQIIETSNAMVLVELPEGSLLHSNECCTYPNLDAAIEAAARKLEFSNSPRLRCDLPAHASFPSMKFY